MDLILQSFLISVKSIFHRSSLISRKSSTFIILAPYLVSFAGSSLWKITVILVKISVGEDISFISRDWPGQFWFWWVLQGFQF